MSHFYTAVLLPARQRTHEEVKADVAAVLAPYDEHFKVDEYDRTCWCVGREAKRRAEAAAEQELGTYQSHREEFAKRRKNGEDESALENLWKEQVHGPIQRRAAALLEIDADKASPDPECDECHGTGTHRSTYNLKAQWDWHVIGGRWSGINSNYDPELDPANKEACPLCQGFGKRIDMLLALAGEPKPVMASDWSHEQIRKYLHEEGCNGCKGTGERTKWPTEWQPHEGDYGVPVADVLANVGDDHMPYAVVTPDGEWHQKGCMGWLGISTDEVEDWESACRKLLESHRDCVLVTVDCHI